MTIEWTSKDAQQLAEKNNNQPDPKLTRSAKAIQDWQVQAHKKAVAEVDQTMRLAAQVIIRQAYKDSQEPGLQRLCEAWLREYGTDAV